MLTYVHVAAKPVRCAAVSGQWRSSNLYKLKMKQYNFCTSKSLPFFTNSQISADRNIENKNGTNVITKFEYIFPEIKRFDPSADDCCLVSYPDYNIQGYGESRRDAVCRGNALQRSAEKLYAAAVSSMAKMPHMVEFSLNFSRQQERSFLRTSDPVRLLEHRLHKYLAKVGLARLPFAFSFDVDDNGRLHAHGVIQLLPGTRPEVMNALRYAGGKISGAAGARQLMFTGGVDRDPAIWAKYTTRHRKKVRELFERFGVTRVRTCYVSTSYRQLWRRAALTVK
jgi:hypothetical protein